MHADARSTQGLGLAEALVPVLLHRLANATQLLGGVRALMELEGELPEGACDDLASLSDELDRTGFALAVLACAQGANLLLERREKRALAVAHELAAAALRLEGRALEAGELPAVEPDAADGWQLPWAAVASWVAAGRALPSGATLAWRIERDADEARLLAFASPEPAGRARLREALAACGAELVLDEPSPRADALVLRFPARWLAQRG